MDKELKDIIKTLDMEDGTKSTITEAKFLSIIEGGEKEILNLGKNHIIRKGNTDEIASNLNKDKIKGAIIKIRHNKLKFKEVFGMVSEISESLDGKTHMIWHSIPDKRVRKSYSLKCVFVE